jgi:hypothetical protein
MRRGGGDRRVRQKLRTYTCVLVALSAAACSADRSTEPEGTGSSDEVVSEAMGSVADSPIMTTAIASTSFRNLPSGLTPFAEISFSGSTVSGSAVRGVWAGPFWGSTYLKLPVSDATASASPTARSTWPSGLTAGNAPVSFAGWNKRGGYSNHTRYRKLYISLWLKIPSKDYENQTFGTKLFYLAHGNTYRYNHDFLFLSGNGSGTSIQTNISLALGISPADDRIVPGSLTYRQNTSSAKFTVGAWHQVELYFDVGTTNNKNGTARVWVDGTKVMDYSSSVKFLDSRYSFTQGFYDFMWTPVWGGTGGRKSRSDNILIDHVLIAGAV